MQLLQERLQREGQNLGRGILKIDSFLNHQVDIGLMTLVGAEIAQQFAHIQPTLILTAEISGIIPACMTAVALGNLPAVYARKSKPITMPAFVYTATAPSHTKGGEVTLMVSPEFLKPTDRVLIVDDFLATGKTIDALARIVQQSGATLVGIAAVVEKSFENGRQALAVWNVPIFAAVTVTDMRDGKLVVAETKVK